MYDDEDYVQMLGMGSAIGNISGKVKTAQIGFVRKKDVKPHKLPRPRPRKAPDKK